MTEFAIDARNLAKSYGGVPVVANLTLQVRQGRIYGLLGPNGAGKSTTVSMVTGLLPPDSGSISLLGQAMSPNAFDLRRRIGVVPDHLGVFDYLSIWENLDIIREAWSIDAATFQSRTADLFKLLDLSRDVRKKLKNCSYGTRKKVALAMALLPNPAILVLDEPFEGLDPIMSKTVEASLRGAAGRGLTVLITTHLLGSMSELLHEYGILRSGALVASGELAGLRRMGITLHDAYLREFNQTSIQELAWLG